MKFKQYIGIGLVSVLWLSLSLSAWFKPHTQYSEAERRELATFPELNLEFPTKFEDYALDQFPLRDTFRTVKSLSEYFGFMKLDNNQIYLADGYASKLLYPLSERDLTNAGTKFQRIKSQYLKDSKVYLSIVPDKSYFLAKKTGRLSVDYDELVDQMKGKFGAEYIDIFPTLSIEDYYKTDTHWKSECLEETASVLRKGMGNEVAVNYTVKSVEKPFYGVYYGQSALPLPAETISYITNDTLSEATMYDYMTKQTTGIYTPEATEKDGYNFFLGGSVPIVTVKNERANTGKELIMFRDSFGSSIAPWLIEGYESVTLIDIRYVSPSLLPTYVDFHGQDVLFLYSTLVLNQNLASFK